VPRLLRTRIKSPLPFHIPDQAFLGSYTPEGGELPPIFEPQIDPSPADPDVVNLFGSADAGYTILRVGRRHGTCAGGPNDGALCSRHEQCPGGFCPTTCVGDPATECAVDGDCGADGPCGRLFDFAPVPRCPTAARRSCRARSRSRSAPASARTTAPCAR
jgi:hypothetical protein